MRSAAIVVAAALSFSIATLAVGNPIEAENARPGTTEWRLGNTAREREIEGYASATSVNIGESIRLFVSTTESSYSIEIFRLGWYGGLGGRRMTDRVTLPGIEQPIPKPDATGLIECDWINPYELAIPHHWVSGIYLAKLTSGESNEQSYIIFVVRDDGRFSDLLFQSSVATFQAYNNWGGKSLYPHNSDGPQARRVSFNRPYDLHHGLGAGAFLNNGGWEYNMLRWLERNGYDVTYCTDVDTHRDGAMLLRHKAFLSVGHDEYWSWAMREHVEGARDAGIDLGFFGANASYWQIRFEPDSRGNADRTIVGYKETAFTEDPWALDADSGNNRFITTQWRNIRAEASMIGQMYVYDGVDFDLVVENASHWVFKGTGLSNGDRIPGIMGYEVDQMAPESPFGTVRLAHSPFIRRNGTLNFADTTVYEAPSGAIVFATGTIQWSWGLDDYNVPESRTSRASAAVERITRNVLARFIGARRSRAVTR